MQINYKQKVIWNETLIDVGFLGSEQSVPFALRGLACDAVKITTGAPTATAGQWIPGAKVTNAVDATLYLNTGSTAVPVWSLIDSTASGEQVSIQFQDEGVNLGAVGTVDTIDFVGSGVTATRLGNVITVTIPAAGSPSAYNLLTATGDTALTGTTLTLTAPQKFTTGNISQTTLVGTASFGSGSNVGTTGLTQALADAASVYTTLKALSGVDITSGAAALDAFNAGYGAGVFVPGVYTTASAIGVTASKTITLSGAGDYVFVSTGGAITFGATDTIVLTNGASASRVWWVANNAITTGSTDVIKGNLMSGAAADITIGSTNNIEGRLLSKRATTIDGTATNIYLPLA